MTLKEIGLILLGVVFFILTMKGKEKLTISLMIFFLSFGIVFQSTMIPIGLNGTLIWSIWFAFLLQKKNIVNWLVISQQLIWFYYAIIAGAILVPLQQENLDPDFVLSQGTQIINLSLFMLTVIFFIKIMVNYKDDLQFQNWLKIVFCSSIILQYFSYLAPHLGAESFSSLVESDSSVDMHDGQIRSEINRFGGVIGDYELLIDYCMIILAISYGYISTNKYKSLSFAIIIITIMTAILTGTRSFFVVLPVFLVTYLIISLFFIPNNKSLNKVGFHYISLIFIVFIFYILFKDMPVFERLQVAMISFDSSGNLSDASNRDILGAIPDLISGVGFFGNGSVYLTTIHGNEMVSHNLMLAIYAKYGVIGEFMLLSLFVKPILLLLKTIKRRNTLYVKINSAIFVSLLISLFVQETKISMLRYQTTLLIYAFIFILIFFHLNNEKEARKHRCH